MVLERQAPALKRAMSTRPFSLAIEVSMMNFDHLRRGPNGHKGQRSCVRKMASQRVRVRTWGDRGWVRTALARTSALAIVTADQHTPYEMEGQNAPKPGMGRACISVRRWCQHNFKVSQCVSCMQRQEGGVEREAHTLKRGPSSRPLSLVGEVSTTNFDHLRRGPNGPKGQRSCVRKTARQRVRERSWGDRGWVRTALARTSA